MAKKYKKKQVGVVAAVAFLILFMATSNGLSNELLENGLVELKKKEPSSQRHFLGVLQASGQEGVDFLIHNSQQSDPDVQAVIMQSFQQLNIPCDKAKDAVDYSLHQNGRAAKTAALYVSAMNCDGHEDPIVVHLENSQSELDRQVFLEALGGSSGSKHRNLLEQYQNDETLDIKSRLIAARSLARKKLPVNKTFLKRFLTDGDNIEFDYAVSALAETGAMDVLPDLKNIAASTTLKAPAAKRAIVVVESNNPALSENQQKAVLSNYLKSDDQTYRQAAAWEILNKFPDQNTIELVKEQAGLNKGEIKVELIQALHRKGHLTQQELEAAIEGAYSK